MEGLLALFKLLNALYCLLQEIYLWQKHDSPTLEAELKKKLLFGIVVVIMAFSIGANYFLYNGLSKTIPYIDAYKQTAIYAIELNKRPSVCEVYKSPDDNFPSTKKFNKIRHH